MMGLEDNTLEFVIIFCWCFGWYWLTWNHYRSRWWFQVYLWIWNPETWGHDPIWHFLLLKWMVEPQTSRGFCFRMKAMLPQMTWMQIQIFNSGTKKIFMWIHVDFVPSFQVRFCHSTWIWNMFNTDCLAVPQDSKILLTAGRLKLDQVEHLFVLFKIICLCRNGDVPERWFARK